MRDESPWGAFWTGVGLAALVLGLLVKHVPGSTVREATEKRQACERSLPRDQACVMVYVPERRKR